MEQILEKKRELESMRNNRNKNGQNQKKISKNEEKIIRNKFAICGFDTDLNTRYRTDYNKDA